MDNSTGVLGEEYVAELIKKKGFKLVIRNYKIKMGEIDIIAKNDKYIIFVEVRTRKEDGMIHPLETITPSKKSKVIRTATYFMMEHPFDLQPRFDVAAVETRDGKVVSCNYIENAFRGF
ncbi:MAG: YraN family protein [Ruminococcaceae bacterium]|nr:YraN family protein [Oscillospiraceae bacterium]